MDITERKLLFSTVLKLSEVEQQQKANLEELEEQLKICIEQQVEGLV
nr:MAG TPA: period circadian protein-like protein [Caudoviricetes sp.]